MCSDCDKKKYREFKKLFHAQWILSTDSHMWYVFWKGRFRECIIVWYLISSVWRSRWSIDTVIVVLVRNRVTYLFCSTAVFVTTLIFHVFYVVETLSFFHRDNVFKFGTHPVCYLVYKLCRQNIYFNIIISLLFPLL